MKTPTLRSLWMTLSAASVLVIGAIGLGGLTASSEAAAAASAVAPKTKTALFNMYCYWTGEATLGRVPGVVKSRIGELSGEVVEVEYDPAKTDVGKMAEALKRQGGFYAVIVDSPIAKAEAERYLKDSEIKETERRPRFIEPKYNLRTSHPELAALDLTEQQAIALNSWSFFGGPMPDVLTPQQKEKLGKIQERLGKGGGK